MTPKPCAWCGAVPAQSHHPDYTKPAEVVWLCPPHHGLQTRIDNAARERVA